jgi:hypothetical protein
MEEVKMSLCQLESDMLHLSCPFMIGRLEISGCSGSACAIYRETKMRDTKLCYCGLGGNPDHTLWWSE